MVEKGHSQSRYVLLTAGRNEAAFIGQLVRTVMAQTLRPRLWIILDDGSTDGTVEVIERAAPGCDWIRVERLERRAGRSFGAQYRAITRGYELLRGLDFDYVGVLDADITLPRANYFEGLLNEFARNPRLGIAGGEILESQKGEFKPRRGNVEWSVAGGVQTFRRDLFESIGGYIPLEHGGSDGLAVLMAQMRGWEVRSFPELGVHHHRPSSSADGLLRGAFRRGLMEAAFGYDPVFMVFKYARRLSFRPLVLGSIMSLSGYWAYKIKGGRTIVPAEVQKFLRTQQRRRMGRLALFGSRREGSEPAVQGEPAIGK